MSDDRHIPRDVRLPAPPRTGAAGLALAGLAAGARIAGRTTRRCVAMAVPWVAVAFALAELTQLVAPSQAWLSAAEPWFTAVSAAAITMLLPSH